MAWAWAHHSQRRSSRAVPRDDENERLANSFSPMVRGRIFTAAARRWSEHQFSFDHSHLPSGDAIEIEQGARSFGRQAGRLIDRRTDGSKPEEYGREAIRHFLVRALAYSSPT